MNIKSSRKVPPLRIVPGLLLVLLLLPSVNKAETLTLEQALELAFAQSPTMQTATNNLLAGEHNLKAQQAALKSQFNLTVTPYKYSRNEVFNDLAADYITQEQTSSSAQLSVTQPIKWTDGTLSLIEAIDRREASSSYTMPGQSGENFGSNEDATYNNNLFIRLSQPLFTYNRTQMQLRELELALENAQLNYAIQKLQIESRVTQQFLNLYYRQQSVTIAAEELANAQESYAIIKSKADAGISALEELYQADLTQASSRSGLENAQMQYDNALDEFKIQLGLPLSGEIKVIADVHKQLVEVDLARAVEHGLRNRMELRQYDIAIENALDDLVRTGAQNEFRASVDLSYGLTGTSTEFSEVYKSPSKNQSIAISFNIPLWDWGEKKHRLAAGEAQVNTARLDADEEAKQVEYEIRQAYRSLLNQVTQIEIAEKNVKNAKLTYEINLERYKNGDLSSKDMSFYQNQLSTEQLNEVSALINYQVAVLDLKIRSLYDFEKNRSVLETK